ncbi:SWI/SNF-related matrix-associated actin-dependent regulator of chromatin subfamily A containing DEAD/H box 1-like isoform X2 [Artemia franciscana]|nr:hypothetical protein QYM36_010780 [Artemia franciscana]
MSDISAKLKRFSRIKPSSIKPFIDSDEEEDSSLKSNKENYQTSPSSESLGNENASFDGLKKTRGIQKFPSESESGSPTKELVSLSSQNAEECQEKINQLKSIFPGKDELDIQDVLCKSKWDLNEASDMLLSKGKINNKTQASFDSASIGSKTSTSSSSSPSIGSKKRYRPMYQNEKLQCKRVKVDMESDEEEVEAFDAKIKVYFSENSDEDEDNNVSKKNHNPTQTDSHRKTVLEFYNEATLNMLAAVPRCSKKKAETIIEMRPFATWNELVKKFKKSKTLTTDMLNAAIEVIMMHNDVDKLMKRCEKISANLLERVEDVTSGRKKSQFVEQPALIPKEMKLSGYQVIGLNWLVLMHKQGLNGVLADEMGLGKTIQAISFLAYLLEAGHQGPHLIVVPSSTLDNWEREIRKWIPSVELLVYHGSQEERRLIRVDYMHGHLDNVQLVLSTYNMVISSSDDRALFKKMGFEYVIYDEAHMLKNMGTQRYEQLMRVSAPRRVLLTGTPLQNSLVELMSLLVFVMPEMFHNKMQTLKNVFSMFPKGVEQREKTKFESERIAQAKNIMKPFFLRRLKSEVLQDLPKKTEKVIRVPMAEDQQKHYCELVNKFSKQVKERGGTVIDEEIADLQCVEEGKPKKGMSSGGHMLMDLRKLANHPLLLRYKYTDTILKKMARELMKEPIHAEAREDYILEDLKSMSDFELHNTCYMYPTIKNFILSTEDITISGKFAQLDVLLPIMKEEESRVLLFSQFVIMLDILEVYLKSRKYKYLRLDGSTPVSERLTLIDKYTNDPSIFIFLLSTKAGGLGINLTAANTVIIHDIDFNPHNDKQAEDRCHRLGQTREVKVIRLISKETIEEGMLQVAEDKLRLEKDISSDESSNVVQNRKDVAKLLKYALRVDV